MFLELLKHRNRWMRFADINEARRAGIFSLIFTHTCDGSITYRGFLCVIQCCER